MQRQRTSGPQGRCRRCIAIPSVPMLIRNSEDLEAEILAYTERVARHGGPALRPLGDVCKALETYAGDGRPVAYRRISLRLRPPAFRDGRCGLRDREAGAGVPMPLPHSPRDHRCAPSSGFGMNPVRTMLHSDLTSNAHLDDC